MESQNEERVHSRSWQANRVQESSKVMPLFESEELRSCPQEESVTGRGF